MVAARCRYRQQSRDKSCAQSPDAVGQQATESRNDGDRNRDHEPPFRASRGLRDGIQPSVDSRDIRRSVRMAAQAQRHFL
jgi:hypothetical protein